MELSWVFYSIIATFSFGIFSALLKLPSAKKQSSLIVLGWVMLTMAILSIIIFNKHLALASPFLLLVAGAWALFFVSLTLIQMFSLKSLNANTLFPITTALSLIAVTIVGITIFKDQLSQIQILGIVIIVSMVYFLLRKNNQIQITPKVILVGLGIVLLSATHKSIQKIATLNFDIYSYMIYQYVIGFILVALFSIFYYKKKLPEVVSRKTALTGMLTGIVSFIGGAAILKALSIGPFTPIMAIHSTYILVMAITTSIFFREKLTRKILLLTLLAIAGVILVRLG